MTPLLSMKDVSVRWWRGRHEIIALDTVSLEIERGEFVAVFGKRAAGKTTLLRVAAGLTRPHQGAVLFDGERLPHGRLGGLPPGIGWTQRSGPFTPGMSMLDYVALPLLETVRHPEARHRAFRELERMSARRLADARWGELSDAERTVAMLARVLVRTPRLLLVDDPTIGLDMHEREVILGLLRRVADDGATVLIAVPEVSDVLRADRLLSLAGGELMEPRQRLGDIVEFPGERPA